jgi:hypothetical protein
MGPSGCGKSSLIRAGVIPRLRAHGLRGMGSVWLVATCTPRDDPMAELVAALCSFLSPADRDAASVRSFLEGATSLAEFRTSYLEHLDPEAGLPSHYQRSNFTADEVAARREAANLFLLVDQFEEVFATEAALAPGVVQFASLLSNTMDEAERCKLKVFVLITNAQRESPPAFGDTGPDQDLELLDLPHHRA